MIHPDKSAHASQYRDVMETIYERPRDYDLEHEGDDDDVSFYLRVIARVMPTPAPE